VKPKPYLTTDSDVKNACDISSSSLSCRLYKKDNEKARRLIDIYE